MSKQEDRSRKAAEWLAHLRGWKDSGQSLSAYAKGHGLAVWAIYQWRRVLIDEGRWQEQSNADAQWSTSHEVSAVPLRFARVAVTDSLRPAPIIVRVLLGNGRRAEIELAELDQLAAIMSALERRA